MGCTPSTHSANHSHHHQHQRQSEISSSSSSMKNNQQHQQQQRQQFINFNDNHFNDNDEDDEDGDGAGAVDGDDDDEKIKLKQQPQQFDTKQANIYQNNVNTTTTTATTSPSKLCLSSLTRKKRRKNKTKSSSSSPSSFNNNNNNDENDVNNPNNNDEDNDDDNNNVGIIIKQQSLSLSSLHSHSSSNINIINDNDDNNNNNDDDDDDDNSSSDKQLNKYYSCGLLQSIRFDFCRNQCSNDNDDDDDDKCVDRNNLKKNKCSTNKKQPKNVINNNNDNNDSKSSNENLKLISDNNKNNYRNHLNHNYLMIENPNKTKTISASLTGLHSIKSELSLDTNNNNNNNDNPNKHKLKHQQLSSSFNNMDQLTSPSRTSSSPSSSSLLISSANINSKKMIKKSYKFDEINNNNDDQSIVNIPCIICNEEKLKNQKSIHKNNCDQQQSHQSSISPSTSTNSINKKIKRSNDELNVDCGGGGGGQRKLKNYDDNSSSLSTLIHPNNHNNQRLCCRHQKYMNLNNNNDNVKNGVNHFDHQPYCCLYGSSSPTNCSPKTTSKTTIAHYLEPDRDQLSSSLTTTTTATTKTTNNNSLYQYSASDQILSNNNDNIDNNNNNMMNNFSTKSTKSPETYSSMNFKYCKSEDVNNNNKSNTNNHQDYYKYYQQQQQQQQLQQQHAQQQSFMQVGRMRIEMKEPKLLLVFENKYDKHCKLLQEAGINTGFSVVDIIDAKESAINEYVDKQYDLIIIDCRLQDYNRRRNYLQQQSTLQSSTNQSSNQRHVRFDSNNSARTKFLLQDSSTSTLSSSSPFTLSSSYSSSSSSHPPVTSSSSLSTSQTLLSSSSSCCDINNSNNPNNKQMKFDPLQLCSSIRDIKGSEFTIIIAFMYKNYYNDPDQYKLMMDINKSGFNRYIQETEYTNNYRHYQNELIQLKQYELLMQLKLRALNTMLIALDSCKDGIVITGPSHDIRYVNHSIEKMFGFRAEDMIGEKQQEFFQNDLIRIDVDEKINNYNDGKEWEGQIYHRRKSGESIPIWNRIMPINYRKGVPESIIYIKEFPFLFIDKLMSPEREFTSSHGSLIASSSSPNNTQTSNTTTTATARGALRKMSTVDYREARRPSLAKFNSISMVEAPIIKIINILMAIKETGPTLLAPTIEKAIDILKNSEIFDKFQNQFKPDDQVTSELISSLMNTSNKSSNRRMSHDVPSLQHHKNSASYHLTQTMSTPAYVSSQYQQQQQHHHHHHHMIIPNNIKKLLDDDLKWNFDVIELERISENRPLLWLGSSIFERFNVLQTLNCSETVARNWLSMIEANYRKNPYHNSTHAADVMQATAYFLMSERLKTLFDPLDQAICLIAAIIHDVDHPGRNSAFLSNSNHELAILYNDISVLESHHASFGFRLTVHGPDTDRVNIFKNIDRETYRECRQSIIDMVLATEMTKHFEHLTKFVRTFQSFTLVDDEQFISLNKYKNDNNNLIDDDNISMTTAVSDLATPENIVLIKRMLIKCADVSNPGRPTKLCETWANRIATEYCDQTEEEKRRCLPVVMPTFDRRNCSIPKSQIGFIDYFANDMFEAWHSFGNYTEMIENMNINYQYWKDKLSSSAESRSRKVSETDDEDCRKIDE